MFEDPIAPFIFGRDLINLFGGISMGDQKYGFKSENATVRAEKLAFYDDDGNPVLGSCSWSWAEGVTLQTCAACGLKFPQLSMCPCGKVKGHERVFYCDRSCQIRHRPEHKAHCVSR